MTPFFWFRWIRRVLLAVVLVVVVGFGYLMLRVWWVGIHDAHPRSDAIVVLGASQYNGRPTKVFEARLDHARALYTQHVADRVVTVGYKQPGDNFTEAQAGADWLAAHGVPRSALVPVPAGTDTLGSLQAVAAEFKRHGWRTAVIVTDPWHSLRSRTMARDNGIDAQTSPDRTGPANHGLGTELRYIARESAAYLYYEVGGGDGGNAPGAL